LSATDFGTPWTSAARDFFNFLVEIMAAFQLSPEAQQVLNVVLIWIGFGTLAGLLAVVILPVRHPSGPIATLLLGIFGSVLGLFALTRICDDPQFNPIGPLGFFAATAGAFLLHILFRAGQACVKGLKKEEEAAESQKKS
jgi:uncharacterized membrane protein YeaQ/YmgE (transglycosylase-associated protein family)